jgi:RNA polymerase sigma-70 factor (ECF subfamily)
LADNRDTAVDATGYTSPASVESTEFDMMFDAAVREHRDRVFGFAIHFLGNRTDAEDVTQDVFVRLWKNRTSVDPETIQPWLLRVARNACVDVYRRMRLHRSLMTEADGVADRIASTTQAPDQWTEQQLFDDRLADALETLSEPQKSIVILRELQGLKYEEICDTLGLPMATVKVYLHRGRRALRKQLNDVYHAQFV